MTNSISVERSGIAVEYTTAAGYVGYGIEFDGSVWVWSNGRYQRLEELSEDRVVEVRAKQPTVDYNKTIAYNESNKESNV